MLASGDRYILISADTHAGGSVRGYKQYLESKWHDQFDAWADAVEQRLLAMGGGGKIAVGSDAADDMSRNWDSARRLKEMYADGVVAEVIFPNTQPPFAPIASSSLQPPKLSAEDGEARWAGLRAHNRWLVDFCTDAPGQRAGIIQTFLNDVPGTVRELEWAKEHGLTGGILIPGCPPGSGMVPLYAPGEYEPIWAACEDLGHVVHTHSGSGTPDYGPYHPLATTMFMLEVRWWAHRPLWQLIFEGVFQRHPTLQFVIAEAGSAWVPDTLKELDRFYGRMKYEVDSPEHHFGGACVETLDLKPSEYFARNCHIAASFLRPNEAPMRHQIGMDKLMWGSDYPHRESSYPYTKEHLRLTFDGVPADEIEQIVTVNTANLYGFDLDVLAPMAAQHGPTVTEVATPISLADIPHDALMCPAFAAENQRSAA